MIVSAAIRLNSGLILSLPRPARHHDIIQQAAEAGITEVLGDQGFLDMDGHYLDRKRAKVLAFVCKQKFIRQSKSKELFSEDLW